MVAAVSIEPMGVTPPPVYALHSLSLRVLYVVTLMWFRTFTDSILQWTFLNIIFNLQSALVFVN